MSRLLYKTLSVCPQCALIEGKGITQIPGRVEVEQEQVFLIAECKEHGEHRTLYCRDASFFQKTLQFKAPTDSLSLDIEDLPRILRGEGRGANRPLSFSIKLWENDRFVSDDEIREHLTIFRQQMQNREDLTYILKLEGKICTDMEKLNERVEFITKLHKGPTVLECTYDRLILVSRLPNSVFQCPYVYPAVKYYFKSGQEEDCIQEMERFHKNITIEFEEMASMCTIVLERTDFAWPNLSGILKLVRSNPKFWRYVIFSAEREPGTLLSVVRDMKSNRPVINSVDPCEILQLFSDNSNLRIQDFIPASAILMIEPLLYLLNYGLFSLKISPFCGFVNILITDGKHVSKPLNQLLDIPKLYQKIIPLLPRIRANKYEISLPLANTLRKIIKSCKRPGVKFEVVKKVMGRESALEMMKSAQFIIFHNTMDIGSVDILRRCSCAVAEKDRKEDGRIVSSCTGCI